jgi:hypothetical protein
MRSIALASEPISALRRSRRTAVRICAGAFPSAAPALLMTRLTRPKSATATSAQRETASRSATSSCADVILTPKASHCATVSARPASSMSLSARRAPCRANAVASARPMPEPAPVRAGPRPLKVLIALPWPVSGRCRLERFLRCPRIGELHDRVVDIAHLQRAVVAQVALVHLPGVFDSLLGQQMCRALDVS